MKKLDAESLPNDVDELKRLLVQMAAEHEEKLELLQSQIESERSERIEQQNKVLEHFEEIQQLRRRIFGRSAERLPEEDRRQLWLFNEAELIASGGDPRPKSEIERVPVRAHTRVKRGRKPLPADLPRVIQVHDIPEEEKVCGCGKHLNKIGEEPCEKLEIVPAKVQVRRHVRPKYACRKCEGSGDEDKPAVRIAPVVPQLLPKSIASPALIAYMIVSKFCDALPFYRQERQFQRMGVDVSRQDMSNWTLKVFERVNPMLELLRRQILSGSAVGIDETTVQVMGEEGRANTSKSFMWVYKGGNPEWPVVEYQYHPSRSGKIPLKYLQGYNGYIQTDGYKGYNELGRQPGIEHAGCWAHVRRGFFEARVISKKSGSADEALARIDKIFAIERALRAEDLEPERFVEKRRSAVEPILEKLRTWLDSRQPQVPPRSLLGKAIEYAVDQWPKLSRYLDCPYLHPDNNECERAIRPFVVGRKNWLIAGSPAGATASAGWYSIIESSKLNGVEPYLYLRHILSHLPVTRDPKDYQALLPWNIKKESLLDFDSALLY
jgi:transposase